MATKRSSHNSGGRFALGRYVRGPRVRTGVAQLLGNASIEPGMSDKKYWFRRNPDSFGLSFRPISRAGWIATVNLLGLASGGTVALLPFVGGQPFWPLIWALCWIAIILIVAIAKSEPRS